MKKGLFSVLFILIGINAVHAEIYTWTDSEGVTHFSDQPGPGAKSVHIAPVQTYSPPPASSLQPPPTAAVAPPPAPSYELVQITAPKNEETIRNPQGYIPVTVDVQPALAEGDTIQLLVDGQPTGHPQTTGSFSLQDIMRGEHKMVAQIMNAKGEVLKSSESITVFMMQPRVNMGNPSGAP